ncbi:MAG: DNA topoisomerase [bacterium]|nr:DNA topoisomerase [bacterium]
MKLVLTHTPAQAKTLTDVLGDGWRVEPCYGMVRELPGNELGVDVEHDFRPTLTIASGKSNHVRRLMKAIRECEAVYAATPPTLDGEAMAWHVLALSPDAKDKSVYRVVLSALTPDAIRAAFAAPRPLDMRQIEAYMTRRIIERLIAWSINAQARKTLGFKTSFTYDGMVTLRLVAEREHAVAALTPQIGWRASVTFDQDGIRFTAPVLNAKGAPLTMRNEEQARQLETLFRHGVFWVDKTGNVTKNHPAPAAVTLRALIETAERELGLTPEHVLSLVGTLYEAGWITHSDAALPASLSEAAQVYIRLEYGTDYVASGVVVIAGIAPADVNRLPEDLPGDGAALYALVWKYFIAAHMAPAQERITGARILVGATMGKPYPLELRGTAARLYFDGWRRVLPIPNAVAPTLPSLVEGGTLQAGEIVVESITSEPLPSFTRAALVNALVDTGLSLEHAVTAVEGLLTAQYVSGDERLTLTENGRVLAQYLSDEFDELTSPACAAQLQADIAHIASGEGERLDVLRAFWLRFGEALRPVSAPPENIAPAAHKPIVLRPVEEV